MTGNNSKKCEDVNGLENSPRNAENGENSLSNFEQREIISPDETEILTKKNNDENLEIEEDRILMERDSKKHEEILEKNSLRSKQIESKLLGYSFLSTLNNLERAYVEMLLGYCEIIFGGNENYLGNYLEIIIEGLMDAAREKEIEMRIGKIMKNRVNEIEKFKEILFGKLNED